MPISSCDDDRLELDQAIEQRLTLGRELAKQADGFAESLECLLFVFDQSPPLSRWAGVRLSYVLCEIADLGKNFPPALLALEDRRNQRETLILNGETQFTILHEWFAINRALHDLDRPRQVLADLKNKKMPFEAVEDFVVRSCFDAYLEAHNYSQLESYFHVFGRSFLSKVFSYEQCLLKPATKQHPENVQALQPYIASEGAKVFELALGLKKDFQADEIAMRIFEHCKDFDTAKMLVDAAIRAGRKGKVSDIIKRAKQHLDAADCKRLKQVIK